jgi:hypothetical protein
LILRKANRLLCLLSVIVAVASSGALAREIEVSCRREEVFRIQVSPAFVLHLSDRLVVCSSDSVFVDDDMLTRGQDYMMDYSSGIVYLTNGVAPGTCVRVRYTTFPFGLCRDYRLRDVWEEPVRDAQPSLPTRKLARKKDSYDLRASGSKTISIEAGTLQDLRVNQSLSLSIGGKIGEGVEMRGVLSDQDLGLTEKSSTSKLKDLDRVFMEVRSSRAYARVGDLEISESPGQLLKLEREMTGFLANASFGSKDFTAAAATSRSKYESVEINGREGIAGPYVIADSKGDMVTILSHTEKVWVDGTRMKRGANADYMIDYAKAEIHFNPSHLMRDGARIVVDYERLNENEERQFYFARSSLNVGEHSRLALSFVNEGYAPVSDDGIFTSSPTGTEQPNPGIAGWVEGGSYVGPGLGEYIKVEKDTVHYYEYVGEGTGDYQVNFTNVGEGNGTYEYVLSDVWDKYIHVYTGSGAYVDRVEAAPKLTSQIVHLNAWTRPGDWLEITTELAGSKGHRQNGAGLWHPKEDRAYAVTLKSAAPLPELKGRNTGEVTLRGGMRSIGESYIGLQRLRGPDFLDTWAQDPVDGREQSNEIGLDYGMGEKLNASAGWGELVSAAGRSTRNTFGVRLGDERFGLTAEREKASVTSDSREKRVERNGVGVRIPIKVLDFAVGRNYELKSRLADSTSLERTEYYSTARLSGRNGMISLRAATGREQRDLGSGWGDYSSTIEGKLEFETDRGRRFSMKGTMTHRLVDYMRSADLSDLSITSGALSLNLRDVMALSSASMDYRLANTLTSIYGTKLIKVESGGDYDSLGNYSPGEGGYVLSRYEKGRQPVTRVAANLVLELGRKGKVLIQRSLSSRTAIDIEGESSRGDITRIALLDPGYMLREDGMVFSRLNLTQEIVYRRSRGLTLSLRARGCRGLDNRCMERKERKTTGEVRAGLLSSGLKGMTIGLEGRMASEKRVIDIGTGSLSPRDETWAAKLNLEKNISPKIRTSMRAELLNQAESEPGSSLLQANLSPGFTLFVGMLRCDAGLSMRRIIRSRSVTGLLGRHRDSMDWNSRFNLRRGRYTSMSVEYSGSKSRGLPTIHNLRASLAATF